MRMLSDDRPEPAEKKARTSRMSEAKRKLIVLSAHPHRLVHNAVYAPKLAVKFPRLYSDGNARFAACANDQEGGQAELASGHTSESSNIGSPRDTNMPVSCEGVPDTTTNRPWASSESAPAVVVQPVRRGFRYPLRGAATGSSSHRSFLPKGVFGKEGGCADRGHCSEDDQRSDL